MKRHVILVFAIAALVAVAVPPAAAQSAFKVPFPFESSGKKFAAGNYVVTKTADNKLTFQQVSTGKESAVAFTEALKTSDPPATGPQLVFDEVGNFEPSYTEYFTVYVLAEVWLTAQDGYLVHATKGAHKNRIVKAEAR